MACRSIINSPGGSVILRLVSLHIHAQVGNRFSILAAHDAETG